MKEQIFISIIIPIYNCQDFLEICLESIREQTYKQFEVLMVDDGSYDMSNNICKSFTEKDSRFSLITQNNKGVSAARNRGLDAAIGEWIMFVDADDYIKKDYLAEMVDCINNNVNIIASDYCEVDGNGVINRDIFGNEVKIIKGINDIYIYLEKNWAPWSKLYNKNILHGIRFDEKLNIAEDLDFVCQLVCNKEIVLSLNHSKGYCYRTDNVGAMKGNYNKGFINALEREEAIYQLLLEKKISDININKLITNGLVLFMYKYSLLDRKEQRENYEDFISSREIVSRNKYMIMNRFMRKRKGMINILLIVYVPHLYILMNKLNLFIKYRLRIKTTSR